MSESKVVVQPLKHATTEAPQEEDLERLAELLRGKGLEAEYRDPTETPDERDLVRQLRRAADKDEIRYLLAPRRARPPRRGPPAYSAPIPLIELYETICIWFASGAVGALGGAAAFGAVKWMRERFLKRWDDRGVDRGVVRLVVLIEDCGETASGEKIGVIRLLVALSGGYSTPVVSDLRERVTVREPDDVQTALSVEDD